jgi:hypothetical protein
LNPHIHPGSPLQAYGIVDDEECWPILGEMAPRLKGYFSANAGRLAHSEGDRQFFTENPHSSVWSRSGATRQASFMHVTMSQRCDDLEQLAR